MCIFKNIKYICLENKELKKKNKDLSQNKTKKVKHIFVQHPKKKKYQNGYVDKISNGNYESDLDYYLSDALYSSGSVYNIPLYNRRETKKYVKDLKNYHDNDINIPSCDEKKNQNDDHIKVMLSNYNLKKYNKYNNYNKYNKYTEKNHLLNNNHDDNKWETLLNTSNIKDKNENTFNYCEPKKERTRRTSLMNEYYIPKKKKKKRIQIINKRKAYFD